MNTKQFSINDLKNTVKLEKVEEVNIVKKLKSLFPDCYEVPKPRLPSSKGTPDRQFVIKGKFVAIEAKRLKYDKTAQKQLERIREINSAGGIAFVAKRWVDVELKLIKEGLLCPSLELKS